MKKLFITMSCLIMIIGLSTAQTTRLWTGGATGDWDNNMNWQGFTPPANGDIAEFQQNVTVTSSAAVTVTPAQVKVTNGNTLILDLDLTIGDGTYTEDALYGINGATVQIGTGGAARTISVNVPSTQKAFRTTGSTANLNVSSGSTLSVTNAGNGFNGGNITNDGTIDILSVTSRGINNSGAATVFTNNGTLKITNPGQSNAIELGNSASFINNGTVNIDEYNLFGIFLKSSSTFTNNFGAILNIDGAVNNNSNGIDLNGGSFDNGGTVNITSAKKMGIRVRDAAGTFTNNNAIDITDPAGTMDRGIESNALFTNTTGSTITVGPMQFAGVYINTASTFQNDGTLDVKASNTTNSNNASGLVVFDGIFNNTSNNSLIADGGANASNRRAISVDANGTLNNSGTITTSGGFINQNIRSVGSITNEDGGTMQLNDGRVATNAGSTFVNNGLMISIHTSGVGVQVNGTGMATNNGFFDFAGNNFGTGNVTDNGINLNGGPIDAMNMNVVDLAERPYTWMEGATTIGTATSTGELTISSPSSTTMTLNPSVYNAGDVSVVVENLPMPLPITLLSFQAERKGKSILITWETSTEINSDFMAVERAGMDARFIEVGRVKNSGNLYALSSYSILDEMPLAGKNYYRLRQVDLDGTTTYSDLVLVNYDDSNIKDGLRVFPTTTSDYINIELDYVSSSSATLQISDQNGRLFKRIPLSEKENARISLEGLPMGMYFIVLKDRRTALTERVIKL